MQQSKSNVDRAASCTLDALSCLNADKDSCFFAMRSHKAVSVLAFQKLLPLKVMLLLAAMLSTLREREKKSKVKPDPDLDAFMKAQATEGKNGSVSSELVLRLLGLQVWVLPS